MKLNSTRARCYISLFITAMLAAPVIGFADDAGQSQKQQDFKQLVSQIQPGDQPVVQAAPAQPTVAQRDAIKKAINHQAFNNLVHSLLPLNPDQIRSLRTEYSKSEQAAAEYPGGTPPKATSSSLQVDLSPGATPPVVRLEKNMTSTIVFVDATGQPWPITSYTSSVAATVSTAPGSSRNVMVLSPDKAYRASNMEVQLKGLDTPIMIDLIPGQNTVDYRMDFRIPEPGPNAAADYQGLPSAGGPHLLSILDGLAPKGAKALAVVGSDGDNQNNILQAWKVGDEMYVRTRMTLLSPGFSSKVQSADGTNAYELPSVSPSLLMMRNGQVVNINVEGL